MLRSVRLHFPSFDVAREAAGVPGPPRPARGAQRRSPKAMWSRGRVVGELRRLDRGGESTGWADLMEKGRGGLVVAATTYAGGLARARSEARVAVPARRMPVPRWNKDLIANTIRERARTGETLASSKAPQRFVAAARWHFGSWEAALAAAGVDAQQVRLQRHPYTKPEIVALLRRMQGDGVALRSSTLKGFVKLDTVRKLFGSVARAIRAAGVDAPREHPNQKWNRARVVEELKARAARGEVTMTRGLQAAVQVYFGGAHAARAAAGLPALVRESWTPASLIEELKRRARRGDSGRTLWTPCKRLFGSVAAARRAAGVGTQRTKGMVAWDKPALLAELRRRVQGGEQLGRGLTEGLRRAFGSLAVARAQARVPTRRELEAARTAGARTGRGHRTAWRRWTREQVIAKLQAWSAAGGAMRSDLVLGCGQHFQSVAQACAAANVAAPAAAWTPARIRKALRNPEVEPLDPGLVAACIDHFGSVTAARAAAVRRVWSKATVIAELQARAGRGLSGVGRLLRDPAVRLFGSTDAALRAAAQASRGQPARRSRPTA